MTSAEVLVDAVARWLEEEVVGALSGREAFQARVAAHALRIVERELAAPVDVLPDRTALAASIRDGSQPDDPALRARLLTDVLARIAVDSPDYPTVREAQALPSVAP